MTRAQMIQAAEAFEVREYVDDPEPRAFKSFSRALRYARRHGLAVYAVHWQLGEYRIADYS